MCDRATDLYFSTVNTDSIAKMLAVSESFYKDTPQKVDFASCDQNKTKYLNEFKMNTSVTSIESLHIQSNVANH